MTGELAEVALDAARAAADLVREHARGTVTVADTKSSAIDVVTEADRAAEELIRGRVLARRPDDAFLGEEGDDVAGTSGVRWVVDPIDGTVNFLYGLPQYAVSVAAEVDGEAAVGVVVDVAKSVEYVARPDGSGGVTATRNGVPISVRTPGPLGERLVATGFSYLADVKVGAGGGRRPAAAPDPRPAAARLLRPRPVLGGGGHSRRVRRGGGQPVGPHGRWAHRPRRRSPHRDGCGGRWNAPSPVRSGAWLRRAVGGHQSGWFLAGIATPRTAFSQPSHPVIGTRVGMGHNLRAPRLDAAAKSGRE